MLAALRRRCDAYPSSESLARIYDAHATFRMIPAHGTYVAPHLSHAAERAYLQRNNKKKRETPVESSNPIKGDDPWPMFLTRAPRAISSRTNQNVNAASSAGWRTRCSYRVSAWSSARLPATCRTAGSPTRQSERSSGAFSRPGNARNTQKRRKSEMTTLPIRAPIVPSLAGLARVLSYIDIAIEVFAEAQQQAAAAHKRFPLAAW